MGTWNTAYEIQPQDRNNPGYGAQQIRSTRTEVRERIDREHIMGESETDTGKTGGTHREGGARTYVIDSDYTNREDTQIATPMSEIGQLELDFSYPSDITREQYGDPLDEVAGQDISALFKKTIKAVITNYDTTTGSTAVPLASAVEEIFDWDDFVNLLTDQLIKGWKTFDEAPRSNEQVSVEEDLYDSEDAAKLVRADELHTRLTEAKNINIFTVGGEGEEEDIYCNEIHAEKVYGGVWA